jgi:hypothetical protein
VGGRLRQRRDRAVAERRCLRQRHVTSRADRGRREM